MEWSFSKKGVDAVMNSGLVCMLALVKLTKTVLVTIKLQVGDKTTNQTTVVQIEYQYTTDVIAFYQYLWTALKLT